MSDFISSFLFDGDPVKNADKTISASMIMDPAKDGWVGIPHGGIGMGAVLELMPGVGANRSRTDSPMTDNPRTDSPRTDSPETNFKPYPLSCAFRMGGTGAREGDRITVTAALTDGGGTGQVMVAGAARPYITAEIFAGKMETESDGYDRSYLPENFAAIKGRMTHLPSYQNCFVCGVDRRLPGLKRRFHLWESPHGRVVFAFAGFTDEDRETFFRFSRGGFVHPMALLALLDETMGWGGFFVSGNGGVSVRLNYGLSRPIRTDEKLVFFGRGEKVSGRIDKRMFFWASGGLAVMAPDGSLDPVMTSSGQWYALAALTQQMRTELMPEALTQKAFALAGH